MQLSDSPTIYYILIVMIVAWITFAFIYLIRAVRLRADAKKDIIVRHDANINSGRETLALMVLMMANRKIIAFSMWLIAGLYAITPWAIYQTGPIWRRLIVPTTILVGMLAMGQSMTLFQNKRKEVLERDKSDEALRLEALAIVAGERLDRNTIAIDGLTNATHEATEALTSGNLAAQVAQIDATTDLTAATEELKQATTENTATLEIKTVTIRSELDKE